MRAQDMGSTFLLAHCCLIFSNQFSTSHSSDFSLLCGRATKEIDGPSSQRIASPLLLSRLKQHSRHAGLEAAAGFHRDGHQFTVVPVKDLAPGEATGVAS